MQRATSSHCYLLPTRVRPFSRISFLCNPGRVGPARSQPQAPDPLPPLTLCLGTGPPSTVVTQGCAHSASALPNFPKSLPPSTPVCHFPTHSFVPQNPWDAHPCLLYIAQPRASFPIPCLLDGQGMHLKCTGTVDVSGPPPNYQLHFLCFCFCFVCFFLLRYCSFLNLPGCWHLKPRHGTSPPSPSHATRTHSEFRAERMNHRSGLPAGNQIGPRTRPGFSSYQSRLFLNRPACQNGAFNFPFSY